MGIKPFWEFNPLWRMGIFGAIGGGVASIFLKSADRSDRISQLIGGIVGGALVGLIVPFIVKKKPRR
jgi:uncharacterized membrane protein YeaQ/YmgE (transglycosylase-associated protein family)